MTVHRPFLAFAAALFTSPLPLVLLAIAAIPNAGGEPMTMREVAWGLFSLYGVALLYGIAAIFIFGLLVHRWFEERRITTFGTHLLVGALAAAVVALIGMGPNEAMLGIPCGITGALAYWVVLKRDAVTTGLPPVAQS
jgi:hypothetical protein